MLRRCFSSLFNLGSKKNVVSIILIGNPLVWYYTVLSVLSSLDSTKTNVVVLVVHFSALILSALAGAKFGKQMERPKFLILWMIIGAVSSPTLFAVGNTSVILASLVSLFLGISLGFGMPSCMSYFSDSVAIESRGRISGITMLASGIGIAAFGAAPVNDLFLLGIVLGVWRLSSLLVFLWDRDYRRTERKESQPSYKQVISQHSFALYFVPWVMFSLVNYLAAPIAPNNEVTPGLEIVQTVFMGASAVFGGIFMDSIGRKRMAITGFTMLGVAAALLGFSGSSLPKIPAPILYFNAVVDGIAWGLLLVLFILTLWGDLSQSFSSDKYYALGVTPFFLSKFLELIVTPYIPPSITTSTPLVSFTAFFLFLAVLPLVYAPETLPEKVMKEHALKTYVDKAQEIAQKYY